MILAVTGHRPAKLGGYRPAVFARLNELATAALRAYQPEEVITGMATGWDLEIAQAAADLQIPFTAAIPFEGQESRWSIDVQARYHNLLSRAANVVLVSPGPFENEKYHIRNRWMVDRCQKLASLWDPTQQSGGTYQTVAYAKQRGVPHIALWPAWEVLCRKEVSHHPLSGLGPAVGRGSSLNPR